MTTTPTIAPTLTPFVALTRHGPPLAAPPALRFDPQRVDDAPFLRRLRALDEAFFGPRNQTMPSWVLYDCALAPGVVAGLCGRAETLPEDWRAGASDGELVPVAMVSLLPLPRTSRHLIHTLAWRGDDSLGHAALEVAMAATGLHSFRIVAGWSSPELKAFAARGPLRLLTAWTPAHDERATVTADLDIDPARAMKTSPTLSSAPSEPEELQALQAEIEAGATRYLIDLGAGLQLGSDLYEVTP